MAPVRDRRPGFSRRAQVGMFLTSVLAVSLGLVGAVLLVFSLVNPRAFGVMRVAVAEVTAPVSATIASFMRGILLVPDEIGTWWRVKQENEQLRAQAQHARAALFAGRAAQLENRRLRQLLRVRDVTPDVVAVARIVSTSASSTRRLGLLNAGSWQGVAVGQPVRAADGLIGRVIEVGPGTARVLLLTDPESVIPVRRVRDNAPAIAAGRGDGLLDIRSVDTGDNQVRAGDLFVTSGSGGLFAPGVPVARAVRPGGDAVPARPFARPSSFDFAVVSRAFLPPPPPTVPLETATPSPVPSPSASAAASR